MSFIIHIFLTIVFYCIVIIESNICFTKIFYMQLDYGDYDDLLYFLILYPIYNKIPKNEIVMQSFLIFPNFLSRIESLVVFKIKYYV